VTEYSLLWAVVLLLLSIGLVVMEAFIPSWGMLGVLATLCALGGIGLAFYSSPVHGAIVLAASLIAFPVVIYAAVKWWPNTPVGRRVLLRAPTSEEVLPDTPQLRYLRQLVGKLGRAKTVMLPSGAVEIEGRTIDAVSEGMAIEKGQLVKVVEVRGNRVVVRAVDEAEAGRASDQADQDAPPLRPLDSFDMEDSADE
jgi:membrane-bound ClpP family serine protease